MQEPFNELIQKHETSLKKDNVIFEIVGYAKLALVILLGISLYFLFANGFPVSLSVAGALELIALVVLWIYHNQLEGVIRYSKGVIAIGKRQIDRITGKWPAFKDTGSEFVNPDHPYAKDLDIVGQNSLFQFLNTTHTWHGRQSLAHDLLNPRYSREELLKRQEAVSELSQDIPFSSHLEHHFSAFSCDDSAKKLVDELRDNQRFLKSKILKYALLYLPILTFLFLAVIIVFRIKGLYVAGISAVFAQMLLWVAGAPKTHGYLRTMYNLPYKLSAYNDILSILMKKKFKSDVLMDIQARLGMSDASAVKAIKELGKLSDKVSVRHNGIICFILNVLFLWDFECAILYGEWKSKYAHIAESWFAALGEFESLLCFSNFPNLCRSACLPSVAAGNIVSAKDIGHPLIPNDTRVHNDISCSNDIFIISGSNMSGKTTFLRTIGINLVLSLAGSFVCAEAMAFTPMSIMTSMRLTDDLSEGISTFYAELKRIKGILELAGKESNVIFLIDEIFRGTNSADRLSGARAVITRLDALGAIGLVTTHDLELCELANQLPRIKNYSFSEHYKDSKIYFDYKMKRGKSNTTNAQYLMEMVGIL